MRRSDASSFYHYNHLGTALALTGADEAVSDTYRHDAWGVLLERTGSTVNPHTYVGRERYYRMPNADLYHLGFRDYAQAVGRFVTVDPARSGLNWMVYALSRPLIDPDALGVFPCSQCYPDYIRCTNDVALQLGTCMATCTPFSISEAAVAEAIFCLLSAATRPPGLRECAFAGCVAIPIGGVIAFAICWDVCWDEHEVLWALCNDAYRWCQEHCD